MTTSIHRDICSGPALIIVLLIRISMSVCQEPSKTWCEGWTRCKGRTCCQVWIAAKAGPFARVGTAAEV